MFNSTPAVTKNLLLLNVTLYIVSLVLETQGIPVSDYLSGHYMNSVLFEPYQIVTHMFMHSLTDPFHIIFNMFLLVMFGGHLERVWGSKRYFIFYIACGFGAFVLYNSIGVWQIMQLKNEIVAQGWDLVEINTRIIETKNLNLYGMSYVEFYSKFNIGIGELNSLNNIDLLPDYYGKVRSQLVGASGAIFGLLAGFAILFPNTQLMLLFPPIPINAKYLIGGYLIYEIYNSIFVTNDHIAHLAHVGGAIVGIIIVLIWRKQRKHLLRRQFLNGALLECCLQRNRVVGQLRQHRVGAVLVKHPDSHQTARRRNSVVLCDVRLDR